MSAIKRCWFFLCGFFYKTPEPEAAPTVVRPAVPQDGGGFYFRDTILDQLDVYFRVLQSMRWADKEAYQYFSKIGANLIPRQHIRNTAGKPDSKNLHQIESWWKQTLPAQGGVFIGQKDDLEYELKHKCWLARAVYFNKYKAGEAPVEVQRLGPGFVYRVTVYWYKEKEKVPRKWRAKDAGAPTQFGVHISPEGEATVLKFRISDRVPVRGTAGRSKGKTFYVPQSRWGYPDTYKSWADELDKGTDELLMDMFVFAISAYTRANEGMARVRVTRGRLSALFTLNVERTPYFFKDREVNVTKDGVKKRIFHIVRTHPRTLADGRTVYVKSHFRGLREFDWNGYSVKISILGWHHFDINEFDVAGIDEDFCEGEAETVDSNGLAEHLLEWEDAGLGAHTR